MSTRTRRTRLLRSAGWTGALTGGTFLAGVIGGVVAADRRFPRPGTPDAEVRDYYVHNERSAVMSATGQLVSAACLAGFSVAADAWLADRAPSGWERPVGAAGAALAVGALATSGVLTSGQRGAEAQEAADVAARTRRSFVAGGPVHGVGFAALVAALTSAGSRTGVLGPTATKVGVTSAVAGLLCPAYFAWEPAGYLIPAGRFTGLGLIAYVGRRLSR